MSQFSVLKFLEERSGTGKPWVCVKEVAEELELSQITAGRNLNKLYRYGEVKVRFNPTTGIRQFRFFKTGGI